MSHHPEPTDRPGHDPSPLDRATAELAGRMGGFLSMDGKEIQHIRSAAADTIHAAFDRQEVARIIAARMWDIPFHDPWEDRTDTERASLLRAADAVLDHLLGPSAASQ